MTCNSKSTRGINIRTTDKSALNAIRKVRHTAVQTDNQTVTGKTSDSCGQLGKSY